MLVCLFCIVALRKLTAKIKVASMESWPNTFYLCLSSVSASYLSVSSRLSFPYLFLSHSLFLMPLSYPLPASQLNRFHLSTIPTSVLSFSFYPLITYLSFSLLYTFSISVLLLFLSLFLTVLPF